MKKIFESVSNAKSEMEQVTKNLVKEALADSETYNDALKKIRGARWNLHGDYSEELIKVADQMIVEKALNRKITLTEE